MTDQEIKTIQEKLGPEFEVKRLNGSVVVEIKDIWKGVEFAQNYYSKEIYPMDRIHGLRKYGKGLLDAYRPSTEQAYKDQLVKYANKHFGEVKDGDMAMYDGSSFKLEPNKEIKYIKEIDSLYVGGRVVYHNGKWAKKIETPDVKYIGWDHGEHENNIEYEFSFDHYGKDIVKIGYYLAECIQEYLTKKQ